VVRPERRNQKFCADASLPAANNLQAFPAARSTLHPPLRLRSIRLAVSRSARSAHCRQLCQSVWRIRPQQSGHMEQAAACSSAHCVHIAREQMMFPTGSLPSSSMSLSSVWGLREDGVTNRQSRRRLLCTGWHEGAQQRSRRTETKECNVSCTHLDDGAAALVRLPLRPRVELGRRSPRVNSRPRKRMDDLLKRVTSSGYCEVRMIMIHALAWFFCCWTFHLRR
jgi:hypothetical protein